MWSVLKTPIFQTRIQRAVSGRELRAADYPFPLWTFQLSYEFLRDFETGYNELRTLIAFFLECQGALGTFLYVDPTDSVAYGQLMGTANGTQSVFQLYRQMGSFYEPMTAPGTILNIYLNGVPQSLYSVDYMTGLVALNSAPAAGTKVTADFTYYFRCRFVDDSMQFENFMLNVWALKKITFVSVRP